MGVETLVLGALTIASAATSSRAASKQARAQREATAQAERQAMKAEEQSRQAERKANAQQADVSGILAQNQNEMLSGGETLLTGAQGVDPKKLNLGQGNTLG